MLFLLPIIMMQLMPFSGRGRGRGRGGYRGGRYWRRGGGTGNRRRHQANAANANRAVTNRGSDNQESRYAHKIKELINAPQINKIKDFHVLYNWLRKMKQNIEGAKGSETITTRNIQGCTAFNFSQAEMTHLRKPLQSYVDALDKDRLGYIEPETHNALQNPYLLDIKENGEKGARPLVDHAEWDGLYIKEGKLCKEDFTHRRVKAFKGAEILQRQLETIARKKSLLELQKPIFPARKAKAAVEEDIGAGIEAEPAIEAMDGPQHYILQYTELMKEEDAARAAFKTQMDLLLKHGYAELRAIAWDAQEMKYAAQIMRSLRGRKWSVVANDQQIMQRIATTYKRLVNDAKYAADSEFSNIATLSSEVNSSSRTRSTARAAARKIARALSSTATTCNTFAQPLLHNSLLAAKLRGSSCISSGRGWMPYCDFIALSFS